MKQFSLLFGSLVVGCALVGAGCMQRSVTDVSITPGAAPTSTVVASSTEVSSTAPTSQLLFLEGSLPDGGMTSLALTLSEEFVRGTFQSAKSSGMIYGTHATSGPAVEFTFSQGNQDIWSFTGTLDASNKILRGQVKRSTDAKTYPVAFEAKTPDKGADIVLKTIHRKDTLKSGISCETSLEYPLILASRFIPAERAAQMNAAIHAFLGETTTSTLQSLVDQTQADCLEMQKENIASMTDEEEPTAMGQYEYGTSALVNRNERGILSLVYSSYYYTGGAHPNSYSVSQTFDLETGKELAITDLVRTDALSAWIQREQKALLASDYGEMLFEDNKDESKQIAAGILKGDSASSTQAVSSIDQWYLTGDTLTRFYQPYEIAPYAAGIPSVDLPFASWKDLATPEAARWFR